MGSLAQLAKALGHNVTGSDLNVYPPMSTQLERAGIELYQGFSPEQLDPTPDMVVVGNVISRGNPAMEAVLDRQIPYISGPQWLSENLLRDKWVLAVSGTHGKTTTASMLAWILEYAGYKPGYLIGGVPGNFAHSARLGETDFFVIEADEYDTSFFDKRSKFVHYHPNTLIINNLEFDHADIFDDLAAIQKQFHHLIRTVPSQGLVIYPQQDQHVKQVLDMGCWSHTQAIGIDAQQGTEPMGGNWSVERLTPSGQRFRVFLAGEMVGEVFWQATGEHNVTNALNAIAAARHVGVVPEVACEALSRFEGVKRRMELRGEVNQIKLYDDFAHHPTAIKTTLKGLRDLVGDEYICAVIEPRSNTMKQGIHKDSLGLSAEDADNVIWYQPDTLDWSLEEAVLAQAETQQVSVYDNIDAIVEQVVDISGPAHIVVMSNGGFGGIHQKILDRLKQVN